jgi:hypothetical protein
MAKRSARAFVTGAILATCLAGGAWAVDGIDLSALEAYAKQRDTETKLVDPDRVHRVWRALDVKLARGAKNDLKNLSLDVAKLAAASAAWNNKLAGDSQLRSLLDAALDATEQKLLKAPNDMSVLIGQIKSNRSQLAVLRLVVGVHSTPAKRSDATGARDFFEQGKTARDVDGDEGAQIKLWK